MIYTVRVKFDSSDRIVLDRVNNDIEISVSSAPVKGKANKEIIKKIIKLLQSKTRWCHHSSRAEL